MHLHPFRRWHTKNLSQPFTVYEPMTVQTQIYIHTHVPHATAGIDRGLRRIQPAIVVHYNH